MTYEQMREVTRNFGNNQLITLIVLARAKLEKQVIATAEWFAPQESWCMALEDELAANVELTEEGIR